MANSLMFQILSTREFWAYPCCLGLGIFFILLLYYGSECDVKETAAALLLILIWLGSCSFITLSLGHFAGAQYRTGAAVSGLFLGTILAWLIFAFIFWTADMIFEILRQRK